MPSRARRAGQRPRRVGGRAGGDQVRHAPRTDLEREPAARIVR
jgi:hypothetical protein